MYRLWTVLFTCTLIHFDLSTGDIFEHESKLHKDLFQNYNVFVLPVENLTDSVNVSLGLEIVRLENLNARTDTMVLTIMQQIYWTDPRLKWDPDKYGGVKSIRVSLNDIWQPDIEIYNRASVEPIIIGNSVIVQSTGHVIYIPVKTVSTYCTFDFSSFPFDEQQCKIKFGSWTYSKNNIGLGHASMPFAKTNEVIDIKPHGMDRFDFDYTHWEIKSAKASIKESSFECCPEVYTEYIADIVVARTPSFFVYTLIVPSVVCALLIPLVFLLPPDSSEKINIGLGVVLFEVLLMQVVEEYDVMDRQTVPKVVLFHVSVIISSTLSILCAVTVKAMCKSGTSTRPVPAWIKMIILDNRCIRGMLLLGNSANPGDFSEINTNLLDGTTDPQSEELQFINNVPGDSINHLVECARMIIDRVYANDKKNIICTDWMELARVFDRLLFIIFGIATFIVLGIFIPN